MGKNQSASNLTNIIQYNNGNIAFVSGSTTLMQISSSGAITTTGVISGSNALSASYAATASFVTTAQTASFVTTAQTASFVANAQSASNAVSAQTASSADNFLTRGTLTAQTIVVQTITSSQDFVTGSTKFGVSGSNTHQFTGSVSITGSLALVGNMTGNAVTLTSTLSGSNAYFSSTLTVVGALSGTSATFSGLLTISGVTEYLRSVQSGALSQFQSWYASDGTTRKAILGYRTGGSDNFTLLNEKNGSLLIGTNDTTNLTISSTGAATFSSSVTAGGGKPQLYVSGDSSNGAGIHLTTALSGTNRRNWGIYTEELVDGDFVIKCSTAAGGNPNTGNARFVISRDGNVGIGTNSPSAQGLTIYQGGSDRRIMLELNRPNSPGLQSAIQFTVGSSILVGQIQHEYVTDNYNHMSFTLRSPGGGNFVSMWLQNSGYVGIGNSNPATKLNVNNTVAGALLPYINGTGLSYNSEGISVAGSNTNNTNIGNGLALFNNVASVGAYSPVIAFSSMTSGGAYNATYAFISGVYQGAGGDANWSKGDMIFGTGNSYGATMRLKLTQDGALLPGADNSYGFGGSGIRWAAIWAANGTIQTSDEREKKDIINTDLGLDFINKLRPVSYKWKVGQNEVVSEFDGMNEDGTPKYKSVVKPREGKRTHYGLIAQEVESLLDGKDFGGFVHDKETDIMGLRYDQFVPLLIKSIQELNTKLDAANVEIEALKAK